MRLRIWHLTNYHYETSATSVIQMLRLTPRNHDSQYVAHWRIDVSTDCWLHQHEDAFGNITHAFTADGSFRELTVTVVGEVETRDTQGIMRGTVERFPPSLYLRETALTSADANIAVLAAACRDAGGDDALKVLHLIVDRLHEDMAFDTDPTHAATTAAHIGDRPPTVSRSLATGRRNLGMRLDVSAQILLSASWMLGFENRSTTVRPYWFRS